MASSALVKFSRCITSRLRAQACTGPRAAGHCLLIADVLGLFNSLIRRGVISSGHSNSLLVERSMCSSFSFHTTRCMSACHRVMFLPIPTVRIWTLRSLYSVVNYLQSSSGGTVTGYSMYCITAQARECKWFHVIFHPRCIPSPDSGART